MYRYFLFGVTKGAGKWLVWLLLVLISYSSVGQDMGLRLQKKIYNSQVTLIDTAFVMPQVNRTVSIWLYLPPQYGAANKHYPVLYIYAGPHVISGNADNPDYWNVDGSLDSLIAKGRESCMVVAVEEPGWKNDTSLHFIEDISGQMQHYASFFANTLKPFIDQHYKTLPAKENTIIAGADVGGLIAYYTTLLYPAVFGKAGIFSPAFLTIPGLNSETDSLINRLTAKLFFYMGEEEVPGVSSPITAFTDKLGTRSQSMLYVVVEAKNDVTAWRKCFPGFYNFIMADGFNDVIKIEE